MLHKTLIPNARIGSSILRNAPCFSLQTRQKHQLPKLDYELGDGIPPCISPTQLDFHYNKHHKTYVDKLNDFIGGTQFEGQPLDQVIVKTAFDAKNVHVFNNAAQHFNHSFYWKCMRPKGVTQESVPSVLEEKIKAVWGSVEKFKEEFTTKAVSLFGSGWCWLVYDGNSLKIWTGGNAQCPIAEGLLPILTCDVWEHAYYLDYQNRRPEYLKNFWEVVNWGFMQQCLNDAMLASRKV